jgi:hypothetical protein
MPPKKKDAKGAAEGGEEPSEENKDLIEKELVNSYLKMKLSACAAPRVDVESLDQAASPHLLSGHMNTK